MRLVLVEALAMTSPFAHGGDVERVAREYGVPVEAVLDFSASVNPRGLPPRARERLLRDAADSRLLARYPDRDSHELRVILSERLQVPPESIVIGAGADSLVPAAVRAFEPQSCVIPIPAFSEYERACDGQNCAFRKVHRDGAFAEPGELLFLNNPHNPTGSAYCRDQMMRFIGESRGPIVLDEAFIDYAPDAAVTREAAHTWNVVAIRSLTKFYGCPALRVGYAVATPAMAQRMSAQLSAWPVTTLAMSALAEALRDTEYSRMTIEENARNRATLSSSLARLGCRVSPSAANFLLVEVPDECSALGIRETLIRDHSILVRECESFDGLERDRFLRVAVRTEEENARLVMGMKRTLECLQKNS